MCISLNELVKYEQPQLFCHVSELPRMKAELQQQLQEPEVRRQLAEAEVMREETDRYIRTINCLADSTGSTLSSDDDQNHIFNTLENCTVITTILLVTITLSRDKQIGPTTDRDCDKDVGTVH